MIFEYIVVNIFPPFVLFMGIIGNSLGFLILSRKRFLKLPIRNFMRFLSFIDTFYLLQIIADYLTNTFNMDIRMISASWCKIFTYFNYCLCPMSSWSLVFINVERMISITAPSYLTNLFNKRKFQQILCAIIIFWDLIFYVPYACFNDWIVSEVENSSFNESLSDVTYECTYIDDVYGRVLPLMDLFNSTLIPFIILTCTSIYSIIFIYKSRRRFTSQLHHCDDERRIQIHNKKEKLKKDVKFSITLCILNIIFLFYTLPICVTNYIDTTDFVYLLTLYWYYASFATNFWIFFLFNSIFRDELLVLLKLRKPSLNVI